MNEAKLIAYLDDMMRDHEQLGDVLDVLVGETTPDPHASLFLTKGRHEEAIDLAHVLCEPIDLTKMKLSKRVRQQAERMWRRFGRDIDINVDVLPDGFINVYGDLRHASAYIGEIIP